MACRFLFSTHDSEVVSVVFGERLYFGIPAFPLLRPLVCEQEVIPGCESFPEILVCFHERVSLPPCCHSASADVVADVDVDAVAEIHTTAQ